MSFLKTRVLLWPVLLLVALCAAIGVLGVTFATSIPSMFSAESEERNTQVVQAVTREEQIVLVGLGIEGIDEKKQNGNFFGIFVPGTDRAKFLRYSLEAKLGIDGKQVIIEETGEDSFRVTIPEFIFIGYNNFEYEVAVDKDGPLSWTTPGIEESEMVNNIMNDEFEASHLENNRELLMDQARSFYGGIIKSIDDDIEVEFRFEGDATQADDVGCKVATFQLAASRSGKTAIVIRCLPSAPCSSTSMASSVISVPRMSHASSGRTNFSRVDRGNRFCSSR